MLVGTDALKLLHGTALLYCGTVHIQLIHAISELLVWPTISLPSYHQDDCKLHSNITQIVHLYKLLQTFNCCHASHGDLTIMTTHNSLEKISGTCMLHLKCCKSCSTLCHGTNQYEYFLNLFSLILKAVSAILTFYKTTHFFFPQNKSGL